MKITPFPNMASFAQLGRVRRVRRAAGLLVLPSLLWLISSPETNAVTFTVTNLSDSGGTSGSLRWAIQQANAHANNAGDPQDTIAFDPAFFSVAKTIPLTNGNLRVDGSVVINGPGEGLLTIDGNDAHRGFAIQSEVEVVVRDLTIANAAAGNEPFSQAFANRGGAIFNFGNLTLDRVTVKDCAAFPPALSFAVTRGGAIYNDGSLTITNSTLSGTPKTTIVSRASLTVKAE